MAKKDLKYQAQKRLERMFCPGSSKYEYKQQAKSIAHEKESNDWIPIYNDLIRDKIFSYSTYITYKKQSDSFFDWIEKYHPDVRNINGAKRYIQTYIDRCDSSWTAATRLASLSKVYGLPSTKLAKVPKRRRENITRSRFPTEREKTFSKEKNEELIHFCKNTGLRKFELEHLKPNQLEEHNGCYTLTIKGKGGKIRTIPITDDRVIEKIKSTPKDKLVWGKVNSHADIHSYRSEFASNLYKSLARNIEKIPCEERYICRGDMAGKVFDKRAMKIVSSQLGHNRLSVIASHYIK